MVFVGNDVTTDATVLYCTILSSKHSYLRKLREWIGYGGRDTRSGEAVGAAIFAKRGLERFSAEGARRPVWVGALLNMHGQTLVVDDDATLVVVA